MKTLDWTPNHPNTGGWKDRHTAAVRNATAGMHKVRHEPGYALARAIRVWIDYAEAHQARYESSIGQDYFLGPAWEQWGRALRTLLNGETGNLDCGTLDSIILDNLVEQGFGEE